MRVMIVDDEKIIVDGIRLLIERSGYNFDDVYTVYNTSQALEILRTENIDILFSDIKMPVMDGFELIEKSTGFGSPQTILITGFAEFEYVQKALNAGVLGYILKPIDEEQFFDLLKRAVNNVISRNAAKRISAGEKSRDAEPKRYEQLLNAIFRGEILKEADTAYLLKTLADTNDEPDYMIITFHVSVANKLDADFRMVTEEVRISAKKHLTQRNKDVSFYFFTSDNEKKLQCLCVGKGGMESLESDCESFCREFYCCVPVTMYISISDVRKKLSRELYTHSQEAYYEHYLNSSKRVLKYKANSLQMVSGIEKDLKIIDVSISNDDMIGLRKILDRIFSASYITESGLTVRAVYFLVSNTVILTFNRLNAEVMTATVDELLSEKLLHSMENVSELSEYIYNIVFDVLVRQKQYKGTQMTIMKIINYVDANFDKDLSVKQLSTQFGLTPNYLSQIFKKETGENFAVYLNKLRIGKACELLRSSDIKIYEIGSIVGYNDSQYFYRVFKKYVNQTPIEYRMDKN